MNDQISRQRLIEAITAGKYTTGNIFKDMELQQFIKSQPPADRWIPCSSGRIPKHEQKVFITVQLTKEKRYATDATYFTETGIVYKDEWADEGFYTYDSEYGWGRYENVIAWMPAEPFKGE